MCALSLEPTLLLCICLTRLYSMSSTKRVCVSRHLVQHSRNDLQCGAGLFSLTPKQEMGIRGWKVRGRTAWQIEPGWWRGQRWEGHFLADFYLSINTIHHLAAINTHEWEHGTSAVCCAQICTFGRTKTWRTVEQCTTKKEPQTPMLAKRKIFHDVAPRGSVLRKCRRALIKITLMANFEGNSLSRATMSLIAFSFPFFRLIRGSLFNREFNYCVHLNTQCFGPHSTRVIVSLSISVSTRKYWFKLLRRLFVQAPVCILFSRMYSFPVRNELVFYFIRGGYFPADTRRPFAVYCVDYHPEKVISMKRSLKFILIGRGASNQGRATQPSYVAWLNAAIRTEALRAA